MFRSLMQVSLLSLVLSGCSLVVDYLESEAEDGGISDAALVVDASLPQLDGGPGDASSSTDACTAVGEDGSCLFTCNTAGCDGAIVCPEGRPCIIDCMGDQACENTSIDCTMATSCDINCEGSDACDNSGIQCAGSTCNIQCVGSAACEDSAIECSADVCTILCNGGNACDTGVCCSGATCAPDVCTSDNGGNCDCPS